MSPERQSGAIKAKKEGERLTGVEAHAASAVRTPQGLLERAFEDKLVRWGPNDEPASVFLEGIRAALEEVESAPA